MSWPVNSYNYKVVSQDQTNTGANTPVINHYAKPLPDTDTLKLSTKKQNKSNKNCLALITGALITGATIIALIAKGGKGHSGVLTEAENKIVDTLIKKGKFDPQYKEMFIKIRNLEGKDFVNSAYELMVEHLGYKECSPELSIEKLPTQSNIFQSLPGIITINENRLATDNKQEILASIWHEFKHFVQYSDIARTEDLGTEEIARINTKNYIKNLSTNEELCQKEFGCSFKEMPPFGLEYFEKLKTEEYLQSMNIDLYEKVKAKKGIIKAGTEEAQKSHGYIKAKGESVDLSNILQNGKRKEDFTEEEWKLIDVYLNNPMEKEAYEIGDKIESQFETFLNALNKIN